VSKEQNKKQTVNEQQGSSGRSLTSAMPQRLASRGGNFSTLGRLRSEFDQLFDNFFRGFPSMTQWMDSDDLRWEIDVEDLNDKLVVHAEVPGFEPQDFDLEVHDNQLELSAHQTEESVKEGSRHWRKHDFYRSIPLPNGIDADHVDAQYHNGILTVTLPKTEQSQAKKIEVKS
jgi:HSP20 family protein